MVSGGQGSWAVLLHAVVVKSRFSALFMLGAKAKQSRPDVQTVTFRGFVVDDRDAIGRSSREHLDSPQVRRTQPEVANTVINVTHQPRKCARVPVTK